MLCLYYIYIQVHEDGLLEIFPSHLGFCALNWEFLAIHQLILKLLYWAVSSRQMEACLRASKRVSALEHRLVGGSQLIFLLPV